MSGQLRSRGVAFAKAWEGHGGEREPTEGLKVGAAGGGITGRGAVGAPVGWRECRRLRGGLVMLGRLLEPNPLIADREGLQLGGLLIKKSELFS